MFVKRGVAASIVLSIITLGIYGIYWQYCMLRDLYALSGKENNAGVDILLSFVTFGIYYIYLYYKLGKLVHSSRINWGFPSQDNSTVYLVLMIVTYFFGFSFIVHFVVFGMIQDDLNQKLIPSYLNWQFSNVTEANFVPPIGTPYFNEF